MKNVLVAFLLFNSFLSYSQTKDVNIVEIIKADDVGAFLKFLHSGNDINNCYEIRESSYNVLTLSIKFNSKKIFKKCLSMQADEEQICADKTPLMYAVKYNRNDFFEALLKRGVDKAMTSDEGLTAYDYAKQYNRKSFLPKLRLPEPTPKGVFFVE